jgi:hypothetical protein
MGAWGYNFFESDGDLDAVSELDYAAGLNALEDEAKEMVKQKRAQNGIPEPDPDYECSPISMFAGLCEDDSLVTLVRDHLEAGVLRTLIAEKKAKLSTPANGNPFAAHNKSWAHYDFMLLGACAMSLGCKLPKDFKQLLIKKHCDTRLKRDAFRSMQLALGDGPNRYKGVPYSFGSKGLLEMVNSREDGEDEEDEDDADPFAIKMKEFPADVCGGCGAADRLDGEALLSCNKCKAKKYCSKVCQKAHLKQHKSVCKKP